jgi:hypothetical protein
MLVHDMNDAIVQDVHDPTAHDLAVRVVFADWTWLTLSGYPVLGIVMGLAIQRLRPQLHCDQPLRASAVHHLPRKRDRWTLHVHVGDAVPAVSYPYPHPRQRVWSQRITHQQFGSRHRQITEASQHASEHVTFERLPFQPLFK